MSAVDIEIARLRKELLQSYEHFVKGLFNYTKKSEFKPAIHHPIIFNAVDNLVKGRSGRNRLMINIAPRSGKTMMCSVFLIAYVAALSQGRCNIMLASYSTKIAKTSLNDAYDIIESDLFKKLFPSSAVAGRPDGKIRFVNGGNVYPVSPQSSLTGLGAGHMSTDKGYMGLVIIDDLVNSSDALSEAVREGANDWYFESLLSRTNNPNTPFLCIAQRLHESDLCGVLMEREPELWDRLIIPVINKEGESFWEDKYPKSKMDYMNKTNKFTYLTQYQQSPTNKGDSIIKDYMLKHYLERPQFSSYNTFFTVDTAFKTSEVNDWTVFQVWCWEGSGEDRKIYLLDQWRGRVETPEQVVIAQQLMEKWRPRYVAIEDHTSGTALIQQLVKIYEKDRIIEVKRGNKDNKTARLFNASVYMAQGRVFLPAEAPFLDELEDELQKFTELMLHRHDDQCDCLADACQFAFLNDLSNIDIGVGWKQYGEDFHTGGFGLK